MPILLPVLLFAAATAPYNLVIRNGHVIDGTGSPWYGIPRRLKNFLSEHECQTVPEAGLAGKKNGVLPSLAESAGFEVSLRWIKAPISAESGGPKNRDFDCPR